MEFEGAIDQYARTDGKVRMGRHAVGLLSALAKERDTGLSDQLVEVIRELIMDGVWKPGEKLPGSRLIARDAKVSRSTVLTAIDTLTAEGLLEARDRSGTYVAWANGGGNASPKRKREPEGTEQTPFECCLPPLDLFPIHTWRRLQSRRWWSMPRSALQHAFGAGLPELRDAIATHLHISRGLKCDAEQVVVTTGAEAAILMVATALGLRGGTAWTENPTYPRQRQALMAAGLTPVPVRLDAQGLDVAHAKQIAPTARLAIVTPSSQFPTTIAMSPARKGQLLEWAAAHDGWIVEDDYDCEYAPAQVGKPMAAMPGGDRVIYVNTFSRSLFLSLRIGYIVVPPALVDPMLRARAAIDEHTTAPNQLVLCDFLSAGHFSRHVRRCREAFAARREVLLAGLNEFVPGLDVVNTAAASHLCVRFPAGTDDTLAQRCAAAVGIETSPVSPNWVGEGPPPGLLLGFAAHTPAAIRDGVARLAPVLQMARDRRLSE